MSLHKIEKVAVYAARESGKFLLKEQPNSLVLDQDLKDFVTHADRKAQEIIVTALRQKFPNIPIFSEEGEGEMKSGKLWVVDPLDGSLNYHNQDDHWGISIAYVEDGHTQVGVVYLPVKELLLFSRISDEVVTRVSNTETLAESIVWTDWVKDKELTQQIPSLLGLLREVSLYPQIRLSCTASMLAVAEGKAGGYIHLGPEPFDFAAAALVVEKSGGVVTDRENKPWTVHSQSIVASNGHIHSELIDTINKL